MAKAAKENRDLSAWKKNRQTSPFANLLSELSKFPKASIPAPDLARVRNQILDRISIPELEKSGWLSSLSAFVPYLRMGAGIVATLLIVTSLALGTSVAALDSSPGSAIYPLKKIVENIELKLAPADKKAALQIKFADNRAEEVQQVLEKNQSGQLSNQQTQQIIAATVNDLQKSATAAVTASGKRPKTSIVNKLTDISNKLRAASIQSEGQVKIEIDKALQTAQTQEQAIKNLEQAGLKVETPPIVMDNSVKASGKLTSATDVSVSIGTAKFLLTKDTKFINTSAKDLKAGLLVDIAGQIKDNKSYATQITAVTETNTETPAPAANTDSPIVK